MNKEAYLEFRNECINKFEDIFTTYDDKVEFVLNTAELVLRKIIFPFPNNTPEQEFIKEADALNPNIKNFIKSCVVDIVNMAFKDMKCKESNTKDGDAVNIYRTAIDSVQELYSFLFTSYFVNFHFGSNMKIANKFSLLPPIIRCKTLLRLYTIFPNDMVVIDKLGLSITKAYNAQTTINWINSNAEHLKSVSAVSEEMKEKLPLFLSERTMYDSCLGKVQSAYEAIYADFETLKTSYFNQGFVQGQTKECLIFNDYMQFFYESLEKIPLPVRENGNPYFMLMYFYNLR